MQHCGGREDSWCLADLHEICHKDSLTRRMPRKTCGNYDDKHFLISLTRTTKKIIKTMHSSMSLPR